MIVRGISDPKAAGQTTKAKRLSWMTHKTSLILLGATAGAAMILFTLQPHMIFVAASANVAMEDTYRQLKLFGDVFERVRPITSTSRTTAS